MRTWIVGAALSVAAAVVMVTSASQVWGDAASPSVREAARLKYNPPPNWIRHYLGDDRYKLMGGTWKVVSTETDSYYYPAWAPEMLRQSPGIVIGFPSAAAAEEAGYKRSNYPMESPLLGITGHPLPTPVPPPSAAGPSPFGGFSLPQDGLKAMVNRGKAQRVLLADGASSTILPPGWTHFTQSYDVPQNRAGATRPQQVKVDLFGPGALTAADTHDPKARMVAFGFMQMPNGMNAGAIFTPALINRMNRAMAARGNGAPVPTASAGGFGDVSGVVMRVPVPNLGTVPLVFAGRGSKMYLLYDASRGARGARDIIRGFRGR